jgi:HK97 family phage portal protein
MEYILMSLFNRMFEKKTAVASANPASKRPTSFGSGALTAALHWSGRDNSSLIQQGFLSNPIGFRAVKLIAEAAAAVPLICVLRGKRIDTHPLVSVLKSPNHGQTKSDFLEALYGQILLSGNGYIKAVLNSDGHPSELYTLRSERVSAVMGKDGWPVAYDYTVGAHKQRFTAEGSHPDICHIRSFHPQNDHSGLSALQAAARAIDVHNGASAWSKALLENAARPSGALVYRGHEGQGSLTDAQYDRLVDELELYHQGARNAGRPMLLEGGLDWRQMGFSPSDMEFHKTKELAAREIATAFGVPPMILGIPGDATYANYQEANRAFVRLTVLPLVQRVTAHLARWLSASWPQDFQLLPDLDLIQALSQERDALWRRVSDAGFLTDDEKRHLLGLSSKAGARDG